jgi:hypothetical protein
MEALKTFGFAALGIAIYMVLIVWVLPRLGVPT